MLKVGSKLPYPLHHLKGLGPRLSNWGLHPEKISIIPPVRTSKTNLLAQGDLFAPQGQRARNKRQRQESEDKRAGEGNKGEAGGVFVLEWKKGLLLDRVETEENGGL